MDIYDVRKVNIFRWWIEKPMKRAGADYKLIFALTVRKKHGGVVARLDKNLRGRVINVEYQTE